MGQTKEKTSKEELSARVAEGAKWLDQYKPGWENRIDLPTLEMNDCIRCVLGQFFHGYFAGLSIVQNRLGMIEGISQWSIDHGFNLAMVGDGWNEELKAEADWSDLQSCWEDEIVKRRAGKPS